VRSPGEHKQGAGFGYTHKLGYRPIVATRAGTLEALHIRLLKGSANTQRGGVRFVDELAARVRRAGASGEILLRGDSGFWSYKTIRRLEHHQIRYSIGVTLQHHMRAAIAEIDEAAWQPLVDYPATGVAEIAVTTLGEPRLIVRRTRLVGKSRPASSRGGGLHFLLRCDCADKGQSVWGGRLAVSKVDVLAVFELSARVMRGASTIGVSPGQRFAIEADGSISASLQDHAARQRFLVEELGISEEVARRLPDDRPVPPRPE
jgi:hypothetical protein